MQVAEMSIPRRSWDVLLGESLINSSRDMPMSSSVRRGGCSGDRTAPAFELDLGDPVVFVEANRDVLLVARRFVSSNSRSGVLDRPEVVGALVMLEDLFAVEPLPSVRRG